MKVSATKVSNSIYTHVTESANVTSTSQLQVRDDDPSLDRASEVSVTTLSAKDDQNTVDVVKYAIEGDINKSEWQNSDYVSKVASMLSWFTYAIVQSQVPSNNDTLDESGENNIQFYDYVNNTFLVKPASPDQTVQKALEIYKSIIDDKAHTEKYRVTTSVQVVLTKI